LSAEILRGFPGYPGLRRGKRAACNYEVVRGLGHDQRGVVVNDGMGVAFAALGGYVLLAGVALAVILLVALGA
jgi:hypothetical protein